MTARIIGILAVLILAFACCSEGSRPAAPLSDQPLPQPPHTPTDILPSAPEGETPPESPGSAAGDTLGGSNNVASAPKPHRLPPGSYKPAEWNDWQEDPTAEGIKLYPIWDHIEYRAFGVTENFLQFQHNLKWEEKARWERPSSWKDSLTPEEALAQQQIIDCGPQDITITYTLPPNCYTDKFGHIFFDAGFAEEALYIGGISTEFYHLREDETITRNSYSMLKNILYDEFTGETNERVETSENLANGYIAAPHMLRNISKMQAAGSKTHLLTYIIDLGGSRLTCMYFYVSVQATSTDLEVYDSIAYSVKEAS